MPWQEEFLRGSDFSINASYFQDLFSHALSFASALAIQCKLAQYFQVRRCLQTSCSSPRCSMHCSCFVQVRPAVICEHSSTIRPSRPCKPQEMQAIFGSLSKRVTVDLIMQYEPWTFANLVSSKHLVVRARYSCIPVCFPCLLLKFDIRPCLQHFIWTLWFVLRTCCGMWLSIWLTRCCHCFRETEEIERRWRRQKKQIQWCHNDVVDADLTLLHHLHYLEKS